MMSDLSHEQDSYQEGPQYIMPVSEPDIWGGGGGGGVGGEIHLVYNILQIDLCQKMRLVMFPLWKMRMRYEIA